MISILMLISKGTTLFKPGPLTESNCRKTKSEEEPVENPSLRSKSISTIRNVRTCVDFTLFMSEMC